MNPLRRSVDSAASIRSDRYSTVPQIKSHGATYTPRILADFVAKNITQVFLNYPTDRPLRILDPAVGDGELLVSLLQQIGDRSGLTVDVHGFETDQNALGVARARIQQKFPNVRTIFESKSFIDFVSDHHGLHGTGPLFRPHPPIRYDLVIANPPYVRTQVMGASQAQLLSKQFGLAGRVDLYFAFLLGIAMVLEPTGIAGVIISNRFMTTKSGGPIRKSLFERFNLRHVWDLGDTKLFDAAVLPAVLLVGGKSERQLKSAAFTSIYQTSKSASLSVANPIAALEEEGVVGLDDGRRFLVNHGSLDTSGATSGVWRLATRSGNNWITTVEAHRWGSFGDIGSIRVGVKTCADKVFVRDNWSDMPEAVRPELLRTLTTHHIARRFKALALDRPWQILYPYEIKQGRRHVQSLEKYPHSKAYLEAHRAGLESRRYVMEAGRRWYELWVPQDPSAWLLPKLVFRDISERPTFWVDLSGSVVNGDCYWLISTNQIATDLLWLAAAIGNSSFIEHYYDNRFNNKLYAGRRRFITQYVEKFPLPDPTSALSCAMIATTKRIYKGTPSNETDELQKELDAMVWNAFGLRGEEVSR